MKRPLALLAGLLSTACTSVAPPTPIAGTQWRVESINGRATPPAPASYVMRVTDRTIGGQFGCNHFGGDYQLRGQVLVTGAMMMTEMACSEPADSFESWGMAVLQRPMRVVWQSPGRIQLSNEAGTIDLSR